MPSNGSQPFVSTKEPLESIKAAMPPPDDIRPPQIFPHCIVWTPIPVLSWFLPFVGHMGVCDSSGLIYDFAGPYFVNRGKLSFGSPTRYLQLDLSSAGSWDSTLALSAHEYEGHMYNFYCDNCHCFVAYFLSQLAYKGRRDWHMVRLATHMFVKGRHVGVGGFLRSWLPFFVLLGAAIVLAGTLQSKS